MSNSALFARSIIDESGHTCKGSGTALRTFNTESPEPLVHEVNRGLQHGEHGGEERGDSSRLLRVLREFFFVPSVFKSLSSMTERERLNKITESIIGAAIQVHRVLGPGSLESAYVACLAYELGKRGLVVEQQKPVPLVY